MTYGVKFRECVRKKRSFRLRRWRKSREVFGNGVRFGENIRTQDSKKREGCAQHLGNDTDAEQYYKVCQTCRAVGSA